MNGNAQWDAILICADSVRCGGNNDCKGTTTTSPSVECQDDDDCGWPDTGKRCDTNTGQCVYV